MKKDIALVEVVAGAVMIKDGKYFLVQEKQPKAYGLWNLPAGRVDIGESIEEAVIREAKEESGYDVELVQKIGVFHESIEKPVKHSFEAKIIGGDLSFPEEEIMDARWFSYDEILGMKEKLRSPFILKSIEILEKRNK